MKINKLDKFERSIKIVAICLVILTPIASSIIDYNSSEHHPLDSYMRMMYGMDI